MLSEVTPGLQQLNREAHPRLPFGALWYTGTCAINGAISHAEHRSRLHDAVIRVYNDAGNVIETHEHKREFKEW
jgi:hypothetical protein